jgi:hypothetical protein
LEKSKGQIYRVLRRPGGRKFMPRSKHSEKASDEVIAASKKLTIRCKKRCLNIQGMVKFG